MQRRVGRHNIVGFGDQVVSSVANVLVVFTCARVMTLGDFGAFSVGVAIVTAIMVAFRGYLGTSLSVISGDSERVGRELEHAAGAGIGGGVLAGALLTIFGTLEASPHWILLGLAVPFLVWHDVLRYGAVSLERSEPAFVSDVSRLLVSAAAFGLTFLPIELPGYVFILSWPIGAFLGALFLTISLNCRPQLRGIIALLGDRVRERLSYGLDSFIGSAASVGYVLILTAQMGAEGVAGLRGAGTLLGPLNTLVAGLSLVMVPQLARSKKSAKAMLRSLLPIALLMFFFAAVCGSLGLWLPERAGEAFLGATWMAAAIVLPIMGLEYGVSAARTAITTVLLAQRAAGRVVAVRFVHTGGMIAAAIFAPTFGGPVAVAWGMVINALVGLALAVALVFIPHARPPTAAT